LNHCFTCSSHVADGNRYGRNFSNRFSPSS
jgi:hypothetical protein